MKESLRLRAELDGEAWRYVNRGRLRPGHRHDELEINLEIHLYGRGHRITMTEAMLEAGFGGYAQSYRVLTRIMGCGPADYRCKHLKG